MPKVHRIGLMAVHYGKEYLAWAVESLACACDEVHVFYSPAPSFGFSTELPCPDREAELVAEASRLVHTRALVHWHKISATSEQAHRDQMLALARSRGARICAIADADEVWDPGSLIFAMNAVDRENRAGRWNARFCNFWRSWKWRTRDSFTPVRFVDLRHPLTTDATLDQIQQPLPVYHFGYAQSLATMRYKFAIHGHYKEFRPNYFEKTFAAWTPAGPHTDLHPCVNNLWTAEPTDAETLQIVNTILLGHPHAKLEVIA